MVIAALLEDTAGHSSERRKGEHCLFSFIFLFLPYLD